MNINVLKSNATLKFWSMGFRNVTQKGEGGKVCFTKPDVFIDCRGVREPHGAGIPGTGDDVNVQKWINSETDFTKYFDYVMDHLLAMGDRRGETWCQHKQTIHIVCTCAYGIHRSRATKHILSNCFKTMGWTVQVAGNWE